MAQLSFGTILRDERERKGYDIPTAARRLRIRPDILQSIEASDFSRMPPRGYARNMVNAYARFLGLNPTELTKMYLDEAYAEQVKKARSNAQPNGFDMTGGQSGRKSSYSGRQKPAQDDDDMQFDSSSGRMLYVDSNMSRYRNNEAERLYPEERTHRSTRSAVPSTQYTNFYAGPKAPGSLISKLPLIIAVIAIIVLAAVLLFFLFGPKGDSDDSVQRVPVTGVDEEGQEGIEENSAQPIETAPEKVVFSYEILDGQESWIEIYINDSISEAGLMTGPQRQSYDVTGKLRLDSPNPSAVKVYQDGNEAALTDEDGDGVYSITVDFPAILSQWHIDHPTTGSNTGANGSNASGDSTGSGNGAADEG